MLAVFIEEKMEEGETLHETADWLAEQNTNMVIADWLQKQAEALRGR